MSDQRGATIYILRTFLSSADHFLCIDGLLKKPNPFQVSIKPRSQTVVQILGQEAFQNKPAQAYDRTTVKETILFTGHKGENRSS